MNNWGQQVNKVVINQLQGWTEDFKIDPQDWSLAVSEDIDLKTIDPRILEIWKRFYDLNYLQDFGHQCILLSGVLRRVLRMHGIDASLKEVVTRYSHDKRQWNQIVGMPENITHSGTVDTHRVVVSGNLILDWAQRDAIHRLFGAMSPRGFIGDATKFDKVQEVGFFGQAKWKVREPHPSTRNIDFYIREDIIHLTRNYFQNYLIGR